MPISIGLPRTKHAVYASLQRTCNKGITQTKKLPRLGAPLRKELDFNRFSEFDMRVFAGKRKAAPVCSGAAFVVCGSLLLPVRQAGRELVALAAMAEVRNQLSHAIGPIGVARDGPAGGKEVLDLLQHHERHGKDLNSIGYSIIPTE
jgi:hypothetical protein